MYNIFNNTSNILEALENKDWGKLVELLKNAELTNPRKHIGVSLAADEVYRRICKALEEHEDKKLLHEISTVASKMFADVWDATAILMMADDSTMFGALHADATAVLEEYKQYEARAIELYNASEGDFEIEEKVKYVFKNGKLSFFKDNEEYRIFRFTGHY